jgi:hypothetical protein
LVAVFEGQDISVSRVQSNIPFFSSKVAEDLLANQRKNRISIQRKPFRPGFNTARLNPCILLAAILTEEEGQGVKLLEDSGITLEKVLLTLSGATEN